jgi:hypothetical protein
VPGLVIQIINSPLFMRSTIIDAHPASHERSPANEGE